MVTIAIDPDLHLSGVAICKDGKLIECCTMSMWHLMKHLNQQYVCDFKILIEDSTLIKNSDFHTKRRLAAKSVGKNQAVAIILCEFMDYHGIKYTRLIPHGYSQFFKDAKKFKSLTGWTGRTNEDARAAAAMLYLNGRLSR